MISLNSLYELAEDEGIEIYAFDLPLTGSVSTMEPDGTCYIGIDPFSIDSRSEEAVCLAHELGHCLTGSFYNIYAVCDLRAKHERRADKWAIKKLVPRGKLKKAINSGFSEVWELSEYFDLPEPFIRKAVTFYKEQTRV